MSEPKRARGDALRSLLERADRIRAESAETNREVDRRMKRRTRSWPDWGEIDPPDGAASNHDR